MIPDECTGEHTIKLLGWTLLEEWMNDLFAFKNISNDCSAHAGLLTGICGATTTSLFVPIFLMTRAGKSVRFFHQYSHLLPVNFPLLSSVQHLASARPNTFSTPRHTPRRLFCSSSDHDVNHHEILRARSQTDRCPAEPE